MCLSENELTGFVVVFALQLAKLCLVFATPEGRAHLQVGWRTVQVPLLKGLLYTLPAAALIKLFHDWIGLSGRTVCMRRSVFLLGTCVLCLTLPLEDVVTKRIEAGSGIDLHDKYRLRLWGLYALVGAVWIALSELIPYR